MKWISFPDDSIAVHGLPWFDLNKPSLSRLLIERKNAYREPVWDLSQNPAGGRLRFSTDSTVVGIEAKSADYDVMDHITRIGQSGFDIYVDGLFMGSVSPDASTKVYAEWQVGSSKAVRNIEINMPLYKDVDIKAIGINDESCITPAKPFALDKPVVFYGSSITQGGCAATPGTSYQSFISRWLNVDFVNLGFSGNGMGEPELAQAVSEIPASCIVLDHWGNILDGYGPNLPGFCSTIREKQPSTPIVVATPFFYCTDHIDPTLHNKIREDAHKFVRNSRRKGDSNMHFLDGLNLLGPDETFGLVDGVHPISLGFYLIAKGFVPILKKVLSL